MSGDSPMTLHCVSQALVIGLAYATEASVGLRRYERAVGHAVPPIPSKTAKNPPF
jgi:hypothetical protein